MAVQCVQLYHLPMLRRMVREGERSVVELYHLAEPPVQRTLYSSVEGVYPRSRILTAM